MTIELVLLGTAGAPMPVAGRAGIASALVVGDRVFVIDCGRGAPSRSSMRASISGAWKRCSSPTFMPTTSVISPACCCIRGASGLDSTALCHRSRSTARHRGTLPSGDAKFHRETTIRPAPSDSGDGGPRRENPFRFRVPPECHAAGRTDARSRGTRPGSRHPGAGADPTARPSSRSSSLTMAA